MNAPFSITSIVVFDLPGNSMVDFFWSCTSLDADNELVLFAGNTRRLGESEWSSEGQQLCADPWPVGDAENAYRRSRAQEAAAFVSERLQEHIAGRDASLAAVISKVSENTRQLTMNFMPGRTTTLALRRVNPSSTTSP